MLQVAERILRKNPKCVTLIAPFVTYTMTFLVLLGCQIFISNTRCRNSKPV
ncbi:protein of unknown function [Moritella yayanosii]|uniref:Uncharacterized protein n=1 Tax=Moritella yayanosii TaxID=69539 RepID=A0A330LPA8_9GAMM|nr:protein of unknown function [Moritella yayanosii]